MRIGVPKERKTLEKRIALTPAGAAELIKHGHEVLIEENAGDGSFFENDDYINVGCQMGSHEDVWNYLHLAGLP